MVLNFYVFGSILKALLILYTCAFLFLRFMSFAYKIKSSYGYKPTLIYSKKSKVDLDAIVRRCPTLGNRYVPFPLIGEYGVLHSIFGVILPYLKLEQSFDFHKEAFTTGDQGGFINNSIMNFLYF